MRVIRNRPVDICSEPEVGYGWARDSLHTTQGKRYKDDENL